MNCAACDTTNDPANRFCMGCGASLAAPPACRSCGVALAPGARFCVACGTAVTAAPVQGAEGAIVDGAWFRGPGELARRVPPDRMRAAFKTVLAGLDLDGFLAGTLLGKALDTVLARTVRVPFGSVGVVLRDGAVVRVLPPGEQTTAGLLNDLDTVLRPGRSALFLVDRRPLPVSFPVELATDATRTAIQVQVLVSVGTTPEALAAFVNDVVGDRDVLTAQELHTRVRGDAEQAVRDALRGTRDLAAAEREARRVLESRLARTGLRVELTLARKDSVHRVDVRLGGEPPAVTACGACGGEVRAGQRFCISCGAPQAAAPTADALLTADGVPVELDLAVTIGGDRPVEAPVAVLREAAARHLRGRQWAEIDGAAGFDALQGALTEVADDALRARGKTLLSLDLVDARSGTGAWALGARAAMARALEEAKVGREWLDVAGQERELEAATLAAVLADQRMHRDHTFAARAAAVEDAKRHADLDAAERELARTRAEADHTDIVTDERRRREREAEAQAHRVALDSERRRRAAEDEAHAERLRREARLDELRAMTALDTEIAEREQRHRAATIAAMEGKSEAQILALQATELAEREHGAAFAEALGKLADGEAARRERERADARLDAKDERMARLVETMLNVTADKSAEVRGAYKDSAAATTQMAQTAVESHARVVAARPGTCPHCGAGLPAGARFCGGCGKSTV